MTKDNSRKRTIEESNDESLINAMAELDKTREALKQKGLMAIKEKEKKQKQQAVEEEKIYLREECDAINEIVTKVGITYYVKTMISKYEYNYISYSQKELKEYLRGNFDHKSIEAWLDNSQVWGKTKNHYDHIDECPDPSELQLNTFNSWIPFKMQLYLDYVDTHPLEYPNFIDYVPDINFETGLLCPLMGIETDDEIEIYKFIEMVIDHIIMLCGGEDETQAAINIIKWIACVFQYPQRKGWMPFFFSGEGVGKGTFLDLLIELMGKSKVGAISNTKDIFGYNNLMKGKALIALNEVKLNSKDEAAMANMRDYVDAKNITITQKYKDSIQPRSNCHWMSFSNPDKNGDIHFEVEDTTRRFMLHFCANTFVGNIDYFTKFREYFKDENKLAMLYKFFITYPVTPDFMDVLPAYKTEYHLNHTIKSTINIFDQWFMEFLKEAPPYPVVTKKDKQGNLIEGFTIEQLVAKYKEYLETKIVNMKLEYLTMQSKEANQTVTWNTSLECSIFKHIPGQIRSDIGFYTTQMYKWDNDQAKFTAEVKKNITDLIRKKKLEPYIGKRSKSHNEKLYLYDFVGIHQFLGLSKL